MATEKQLQALAVALNALRPDWPTKSIHTYLANNHADRIFPDLIVAAMAVAADPESKTPRRLEETGPWWQAAFTARSVEPEHVGPETRQPRCPESGHGSFLAHNCGACRADKYAEAAKASPRPAKPAGAPPPPEVVELLAAARRRAKQATPANEVPDDAA